MGDTQNTEAPESNMEGKLKPMDADQLREYGHKMVDFIADYYKTIESFPVLSQVEPGYLRKLIPCSAPDHSERLEDVLDGCEAAMEMAGVTGGGRDSCGGRGEQRLERLVDGGALGGRRWLTAARIWEKISGRQQRWRAWLGFGCGARGGDGGLLGGDVPLSSSLAAAV
ncbi:hypothetical protein Dimus_016417 [Dionaea muscipula]